MNFKIGKELKDLIGWREELSRLPFISRVDREVVFYRGSERVVGVYTCKKITSDGEYGDYEARPWFCRETGVSGIPNDKCLLK